MHWLLLSLIAQLNTFIFINSSKLFNVLLDFITGSSNITLYSRGTLKLSLDIVDDEILEADESLTIMFSNPQPQNVVLGQDSITIIITDNDIRE